MMRRSTAAVFEKDGMNMEESDAGKPSLRDEIPEIMVVIFAFGCPPVGAFLAHVHQQPWVVPLACGIALLALVPGLKVAERFRLRRKG